MTLYQELLGEKFKNLSPLLQKLHRYKKQNVLKGSVNIKRGRSILAKFINFVSQLPSEQDNAFLMLELSKHEDNEQWKRTFGSDILSSTQYKEANFMVEKIGFLKMYFRVYEEEKSLHIILEKSTLLGLKIPKYFTVFISSTEKEIDEKIHFFVEVRSFKKVLIIQYDGVMKI